MKLKSGLYRHYKGKNYFVFQVANHSETEEPYVVYRYLYDDYGWSIRPLEQFLQTVELGGEVIPRFRFERLLTEQELADYLSPLMEMKERE